MTTIYSRTASVRGVALGVALLGLSACNSTSAASRENRAAASAAQADQAARTAAQEMHNAMSRENGEHENGDDGCGRGGSGDCGSNTNAAMTHDVAGSGMPAMSDTEHRRHMEAASTHMNSMAGQGGMATPTPTPSMSPMEHE